MNKKVEFLENENALKINDKPWTTKIATILFILVAIVSLLNENWNDFSWFGYFWIVYLAICLWLLYNSFYKNSNRSTLKLEEIEAYREFDDFGN